MTTEARIIDNSLSRGDEPGEVRQLSSTVKTSDKEDDRSSLIYLPEGPKDRKRSLVNMLTCHIGLIIVWASRHNPNLAQTRILISADSWDLVYDTLEDDRRYDWGPITSLVGFYKPRNKVKPGVERPTYVQLYPFEGYRDNTGVAIIDRTTPQARLTQLDPRARKAALIERGKLRYPSGQLMPFPTGLQEMLEGKKPQPLHQPSVKP